MDGADPPQPEKAQAPDRGHVDVEPELAAEVRRAALRTEVEVLNMCPYSLRHSGARGRGR